MRGRLAAPIALLTTRHTPGGVESLVALLERGARAAALQAARARRHAAAGEAILIDEETAAFLDDDFVVRRDKRGIHLLRERT